MARGGAATLFPRVATSRGSLTLAPGIPAYATARAQQLGINRNVYLGILLNNYLHSPWTALVPPYDPRGKLKRVRMQCGLSARERMIGHRAARRWKMSFSALMECLILNDADQESDNLAIFVAKGSVKPSIEKRY